MSHNLVLSGGLGNQMFQYIAAREVLGDQFTIDSGYLFTSLGVGGIPEICDLNLIDTIKINVSKKPCVQSKVVNLILKLSSVSVAKTLRQKIVIFIRPLLFRILNLIFFREYQVIAGKGIGWAKLDKSKSKPIILIGNFQSYGWVERSFKKYQGELTLKSSTEVILKYRKLSEIERPLIVHVRLGDFLEIPELNVINKEYFKTAINELINDKASNKIWLFTNKLDLISSYISDSDYRKCRIFSSEILTSAETLQVMKLGSGYILSNSTYGWWAAYLRENHEARVVVPGNWYLTLPVPYKLIPDNWLKIENSLGGRKK
jgi:hypothetical protein